MHWLVCYQYFTIAFQQIIKLKVTVSLTFDLFTVRDLKHTEIYKAVNVQVSQSAFPSQNDPS